MRAYLSDIVASYYMYVVFFRMTNIAEVIGVLTTKESQTIISFYWVHLPLVIHYSFSWMYTYVSSYPDIVEFTSRKCFSS